MNSSSKNTQEEYNNLAEAAAQGGGRGEKSGDLLELKLGFGSASSNVTMHGSSSLSASESSSCSSFQSQPTERSQELALELKLGFENKDHSVEPSENYHGLWWGHHHSSNYRPFSSSSPSSSLSSTMLLYTSTSSPSSDFPQVHGLSWPAPTVGRHCSERPQPGLWFCLRSIINRDGEILPQIPKAYIRVKNENVTVFMVKTYLVRKLGLSNEAQVEISCMGQNLLHSQTIKHVRDEIWLPKFIEFQNSNPTLVQNPHITTVHHLMSLDYGKFCLFN